MMKVEIKKETIARVLELMKPMAGDSHMRVDFGTGKAETTEGIPAVMDNKISLSNGAEQMEIMFRTSVPQEVERPLEECDLLKPLETATFKASEFVMVAEALLSYDRDLSIETDGAKAVLSIDGVADFPVNKCDANCMKALIPHRNNSPAYEQFDPDVMTIRFVGKELIDMVKAALPLTKKVGHEALRYFRFIVKDIPLETVVIDGKNFPKYNTLVQSVATNQISFVRSSCKCYSRKGSGADIVKRVSAAKDVKDPIISFEKKGEDVTPVVTTFADYYADYKKRMDLKEDAFQFGIPFSVMENIIKLAGIDESDYVDVLIGKRYVQVFMKRIGFIYTAPQKSLEGTPDFVSAAHSILALANDGSYVEFDSKELFNAMKLMGLYEKDPLVTRMPLKLEVTDEGILVKRGEAKSLIKSLKAECNVENGIYGLDYSYLPCIISALPAGTFRFTFDVGGKPILVFTKGDVALQTLCDAIIVGGIDDVDKSIEAVKEQYDAEMKAKAKKEKDKKKD